MNFVELATAILNTLAICLACMSIALPVGTLLAFLLVRTNVYGRKWGWFALGSQLAVPLYVLAGGWSAGFGLQGWLNLSDWLGTPGVAAMQSSTGLLLAVAFIHALASIPWVCLITSLGLIWTNRNQEETAMLEGGSWAALWRVALPKLRPWLFASGAWCVVPILTEMVVTNLYQVPTVAEQIYLDASRGSVRPLTYIAAILFCLLPGATGVWWTSSFGKVPWREVLSRAQHFRNQPMQLTQSRLPLSILVWTLLLLLVFLPLLNLTAKAGWQPRVTADGTTSYGWSPARLTLTVVESFTLFGKEFYWTTLLAIASSTLAFALAILLYALTAQRGRWLAHLFAVVLIAIPGPLAGMLVIAALNRSSPALLGQLYDSTLAAPILAQQFRLLPLAWLLIYTLLAAIPTQSWELAAIDGMNHLRLIRYVILPQSWMRIIAAVVLLFVTSVGELSSSILVLPPGVTTVSMRLFEMLHFGMRHQDSGLCGVLLLLGWCVSLLFWKTLSDR